MDVSDSGPTVAALARSRQHALVIAAAMTAAGVADAVLSASGPVPGARVVGGSDVLQGFRGAGRAVARS
ncbi:hypothetical protein [Cellulomonas pakistanensis]|uniref:Uncharacterized protein n=1 Tax=Cellulomonas pakistanensis TaxID=992287 RepID=A0A919PBK9_9CELL|nr:hypothetical protein [Cellulomonas pakistanensis]GIG36560.1 hypothetical protein Cpa01nite_19410 [Cellulomonas pakistanensis]